VIGARSEPPRFRGRTILVVEDHADSRELVSQLLAHEGAVVMTAQDGVAALQRLESRIPDVILADLRMPGMDGLEFARRVKADGRWATVPIIAMTAHGTSADFQTTFAIGFAAHLVKPMDWDKAVRTIERLLPPVRPSPHPGGARRPPRRS
jgi:CheY-like chemotaxis protein